MKIWFMARRAMFVLIGMILFSLALAADAKRGQKIFLANFKEPCGFGGAKFARMHTQDEWEIIQQAGKFADEVKKICPKLKKVKTVYIPDLYDFSYEYASDSGKIPNY